MKSTRLVLTILFLLTLLLSGCGPKQTYTFPVAYPETLEGSLIAPYQNVLTTMGFGETRECRMYDMPERPPSIADFLAYYQAEMEKQGWEGEPSELTELPNKLLAKWVEEDNSAGLYVIYSPDLWLAVVCLGNP